MISSYPSILIINESRCGKNKGEGGVRMNGINNDDIYEFFDNKYIYDLKDEKMVESKDEFSECAQREPGDVEKLLDKLNEGEKISRWVCLQEPEETDEDFDNNKTDSSCYLTSACMNILEKNLMIIAMN